MRFAAVISHPIQHYSPIFSELAKRDGVTVKVFYLSDHGVRESYDAGFGRTFGWDVPLTEGHDHEFLRRAGDQPLRAGFRANDAPELPARLADYRPDLVWLHGYAHRANWRALLWTRKHARSLFFGDSELLHYRSPLTRVAKQLPVRWFFRQCDAFFTIGDNNAAYYRHYGVPATKLVRGACPVDMQRFTLSQHELEKQRRALRAEYRIPNEAVVVVFSGKFQDYKRPLDLIEALPRLAGDAGKAIHLLFIGEGPLRAEMESRAGALNVAERVHLTGFTNQQDMPGKLAAGDLLAVTSERDAHPLTVTEALPYGMPIVASDRVGCVGPTDTARPGENAVVFPFGDIDELARHLSKLAVDEGLRRRMGDASRRIAPTQDISVAADAVQTAWRRLRV